MESMLRLTSLECKSKYSLGNGDDWYCTNGIPNATPIDYGLVGKDFKKSIRDFYDWADGRSIYWFGVCDLWEWKKEE